MPRPSACKEVLGDRSLSKDATDDQVGRVVLRALRALGIDDVEDRSPFWVFHHAGTDVTVALGNAPGDRGRTVQVVCELASSVPDHPLFHERLLHLNAETHGRVNLIATETSVYIAKGRPVHGLDRKEMQVLLATYLHHAVDHARHLADAFPGIAVPFPMLHQHQDVQGRRIPGGLRKRAREAIEEALGRLDGVTRRSEAKQDRWVNDGGHFDLAVELPPDPFVTTIEASVSIPQPEVVTPALCRRLCALNDHTGGIVSFALDEGQIRLMASRDAEGVSTDEVLELLQWLTWFQDAFDGDLEPFLGPMVWLAQQAPALPTDEETDGGYEPHA